MSGFDAMAWSTEQLRDFERVGRRLMEIADFRGALDQYGQGPVVMLLCHRGHKLVPVFVDDYELHLRIVPGHSSPGHGRPAASPASPGEQTRANGDRDRVTDLGTFRTEFYCRVNRCGAIEQLTAARLLEIYGLAVMLGRDEISINTSAPRR